MTLATRPFDPAEHLATPAAQRVFLEDAFETGDAAHIANALGVVARAQGMGGVAEKAGVNRQALYKSLSEDGNPALDTVLKVLAALDLDLRLTTAPAAA